jgi:hypothetical protein
MTRVFLSHAADADAGEAARLAADLRAAGVDVWMAPGSIEPGESFSAAIDRGLEGSDYFLVLLSPTSLASRWVQTEVNAAIDRAHQNKITVLPLLASPVAVPPLLSTFQQIDLRSYEQGLSKLGETLGVPLRPGTGHPETEPHAPEAGTRRRPPPDAFVAMVRAALDGGASRFGYAVHRATSPAESILDSVVEVALLRIGVAVWPAGSVTTGHMLAEVERELRANPQRVVAVLAVSSGESTALTPHQLLDAPSPNAMVLVWKESDGADAVGTAIGLIVQILTGS